MKDGEVERTRGGCFAARGGQREEEVGHAGNFGGEGDGAMGECRERQAGGSKGYGEGFDNVDVEFIAGVADVGAAPGDGGAGGGGVERELLLETCGGVESGGRAGLYCSVSFDLFTGDEAGAQGGSLPWQAHSSQKLSHPTRYIDYIPQCIGLCVAHASRIAHLAQQLRHHIVCSFNFTC